MLLGSRLAAGLITEHQLRHQIRSVDDGRAFWEHALDAGYSPAEHERSRTAVNGLRAWIEPHIEQGRRLEAAEQPIGIVDGIAGWIHADATVTGRADHAGSTPMDDRADPLLGAAELALAVERFARDAGAGTVGTVGHIDVVPNLINVVAASAELTLDLRGPIDDLVDEVLDRLLAEAAAIAERRSLTIEIRRRARAAAVPMNPRVVAALTDAATRRGLTPPRLPSGAAHDTMTVAPIVPSAMVFVPCRDGVSHDPSEHADSGDAAFAAAVILDAIVSLDGLD